MHGLTHAHTSFTCFQRLMMPVSWCQALCEGSHYNWILLLPVDTFMMHTIQLFKCMSMQGNCPEELPEQLLGCGRIYRSDPRQFKFLSDLQHSNLASSSITPSITPSITSFTASRSSFSAADRAAVSAGATPVATRSTLTTSSSPDGPTPGNTALDADSVAANAGAVAAAAGAVAGVAAVVSGDLGSETSPGFMSPEAIHSPDSAGSAAASSRASLTSGDAPLVVSISPDSSAAGAAGSKAGGKKGSSQGGGGVASGSPKQVAAVAAGSAAGS
jgi:hypothetical protein